MVIFCFEASKDIFAYDNGIPKPASHDASCAQGFGCSSLYAQGTYVIGSCDTYYSVLGWRLMSKKMFSSVKCDRTSQTKELLLQHEVIETMAQVSR